MCCFPDVLLLPVEEAGVLTIKIIRDQAKRVLLSVKFKPDKQGHWKNQPQLSVWWPWKLAKRWRLMCRLRPGEGVSVNHAATHEAKASMPDLLLALGYGSRVICTTVIRLPGIQPNRSYSLAHKHGV